MTQGSFRVSLRGVLQDELERVPERVHNMKLERAVWKSNQFPRHTTAPGMIPSLKGASHPDEMSRSICMLQIRAGTQEGEVGG